MNKEQKLNICFALGFAAAKNNLEAKSQKDLNFVEFFNTQIKGMDSDFRIDCIDQWYKGWSFGMEGAIMR